MNDNKIPQLSEETRKNINRTLVNTIGLTYEEFSLLDIEEQEKLIREYHATHKRPKHDEEIVMIGSGESSLFLKMKKGKKYLVTSGDSSFVTAAGLTPEEEQKRVNDSLERGPKQKTKNMVTRIKR